MKPVVKYDADQEHFVRLGYKALVLPLNHPSSLVSNTTWVTTSPVVAVHEHGKFETENTCYVPVGSAYTEH